eukprot:7079975-Pyramimonas_sp.AAC.1
MALRAIAALPGFNLRRGYPKQRPTPMHPMGRTEGCSCQGSLTLGGGQPRVPGGMGALRRQPR